MPGEFGFRSSSCRAELVIRFGQAPSPSFGNPQPDHCIRSRPKRAEPARHPPILPLSSLEQAFPQSHFETESSHSTSRRGAFRLCGVRCSSSIDWSRRLGMRSVHRYATGGATHQTPLVHGIPSDTLMSRCRFYREVCGLPARVQPQLRQIFIPSGSVGGITVPAELGASIKVQMQGHGTRPGPIVSHPRSKRWTFLVIPDVPNDDMALFGELFRLNASVARLGTQIALPSPADRHGFRVWVRPPRDSCRPSGLDVIEAIRVWAVPRPRRARHAHSRP